MIEIDNLVLGIKTKGFMNAGFDSPNTPANGVLLLGDENISMRLTKDGEPFGTVLYTRLETINSIYKVGRDNGTPKQAQDMQVITYALMNLFRKQGKKYVFFKQEYIRKNTPQFMLKLGAKPKTKTAQKFVEWLESVFNGGDALNFNSIEQLEKFIYGYAKINYGKVAPPYIQVMRNYQWHWVNVPVPQGEKSYAEWAEKSMYIFENQSTCTKSGTTLATIVPIIELTKNK